MDAPCLFNSMLSVGSGAHHTIIGVLMGGLLVQLKVAEEENKALQVQIAKQAEDAKKLRQKAITLSLTAVYLNSCSPVQSGCCEWIGVFVPLYAAAGEGARAAEPGAGGGYGGRAAGGTQ